jgi:hypothetical protein
MQTRVFIFQTVIFQGLEKSNPGFDKQNERAIFHYLLLNRENAQIFHNIQI